MITQLTLAQEFSSAHFYAQPVWDLQKNQSEFGRCFTAFGHGHNYRVEATFAEAANKNELRSKLNSVIAEFDHEHLNFTIPEFKTPAPGKAALVPTTENIALLLWKRIEAAGLPVEKIRLFEMSDLWVEVLQ